MTEPALDFVLDANRDEHDLHFFCLDEMNLAHVEYYFSQFLSAMEEEQPQRRSIALISPRSRESLDEPDKALNVPDSLLIPTNLLFTGTINVDETTHPISDKVIDRANTIEFFTVDLDKIPQNEPMPEAIGLASMTWQSYRASAPDSTYRTQIIEIGKILNKADLGLGYRVVREMEMYLANSEGLLDPLVAFDLQVKQRILPRVRGANTKDFAEMLEELLTFTKRNGLPRSQRRLEEMQNRLKRDGYTSFWR
jgi:5-methylcytosine-specific restriction endonuclease McrBC GTP-binding regulatory subunit McrB